MTERRLTFHLAGVEYNLRSQDITERVAHLAPGQIDKYSVRIGSRDYPPKQVIAEVLGVSSDRFISTDATRILRNLGFKIQRRNDRSTQLKTESEQLFEVYLRASGLTDFSFEPPQDETSRRPDYELRFRDVSILFEVKQFEAVPDDFRLGFGMFDPYGPIREKIQSARKKFQGITDRSSCLVLYNLNKPLPFLSWEYIYAAMLGDLQFQVPLADSFAKSHTRDPSWQFGSRGEMHQPGVGGQPVAPWKTTISAVLVLESFPIGQRRFLLAVRRKENALGRELGLEERLDLFVQSRGTESDRSLVQTRVVVHENPYAKNPLRRDLFIGNHDERYGAKDGHIQRVFVGEQIRLLEEQERDVKPSPMST